MYERLSFNIEAFRLCMTGYNEIVLVCCLSLRGGMTNNAIAFNYLGTQNLPMVSSLEDVSS